VPKVPKVPKVKLDMLLTGALKTTDVGLSGLSQSLGEGFALFCLWWWFFGGFGVVLAGWLAGWLCCTFVWPSSVLSFDFLCLGELACEAQPAEAEKEQRSWRYAALGTRCHSDYFAYYLPVPEQLE